MRRLLLALYCLFHGRNHHITPWRYKTNDSSACTWDEIDNTSNLAIGTISDETLDRFCKSTDFLSPVRLMKHFSTFDHAANAEKAVARMNLLCCQADAARAFHQCSHSMNNTPLVYDTGASYGLTPFRADFIDYQTCDIPVKDISKTNRVKGIGTVMYKFTATNGDLLYLPGLAYHLETADIRLFSPQTYHQLYGGSSVIDGDRVIMHLQQQAEYKIRHDIEIPIDKPNSNLPIIHNVFCSDMEREKIGHHFRSAIKSWDRYLGFRQKWRVGVEEFDYEFEAAAQMICPCVGTDANTNLTRAQKELLLWHWRLGISMHRVQELMRGHQAKEPHGKHTWMPPVIKPKFAATTTCPIPKCPSCELARAKKRNPKVVKQEAIKEKEAILAWDKYQAGDFVSMDQFVVKTPGRQLEGYGREGENNRYHGGTIFNDAATGIIWVENQITLGAGDTLIAKQTFEDWLRDTAFVEIKHIHSDNGVFTAEEFQDDCKEKNQKQTFSGVGAQHQNAKAERAIQTIMWMARTFMLHVSLHWTDRGVDDIALWGFAVKHAAWLYNRIPNRITGISPMELLTNIKADHRDLLRTHVWGCPCYVLDPTLQSGKKIPKWNRRSRLGQFLGFSEQHSSLVARVRNLETGFVSPQYHVVFDDRFETVFSSGEDDEVINALCEELFEDSRDVYAEPEYNLDGDLVYEPPPLDEVWLTEPERRERKEKLRDQRIRREEIERLRAERVKDIDGEAAHGDFLPPISRAPNPAPLISDDERSVASDSESRDARNPEPEGDGWIDHPGLVEDEPEAAPNVPEGVAVPEGDDSDSEQAVAPPRTRRRRRRREYGPPQWTRSNDGPGRHLRPNPQQRLQFGCTLGP